MLGIAEGGGCVLMMKVGQEEGRRCHHRIHEAKKPTSNKTIKAVLAIS